MTSSVTEHLHCTVCAAHFNINIILMINYFHLKPKILFILEVWRVLQQQDQWCWIYSVCFSAAGIRLQALLLSLIPDSFLIFVHFHSLAKLKPGFRSNRRLGEESASVLKAFLKGCSLGDLSTNCRFHTWVMPQLWTFTSDSFRSTWSPVLPSSAQQTSTSFWTWAMWVHCESRIHPLVSKQIRFRGNNWS